MEHNGKCKALKVAIQIAAVLKYFIKSKLFYMSDAPLLMKHERDGKIVKIEFK